MSEYHDKLSSQFVIDYSEVLPIVTELRTKGLSMQQIANELNKLGYLTREKKPFSSVQILRILARTEKIEVKKSELSDSAKIDELFQRVARLESEILELRLQAQLQNQNFDSNIAQHSQPSRQKAVEMAVAMRAENSKLSKSEMARKIAADLGLKFETVRDYLKKL